jgi:hypothetical protein
MEPSKAAEGRCIEIWTLAVALADKPLLKFEISTRINLKFPENNLHNNATTIRVNHDSICRASSTPTQSGTDHYGMCF